MSKFRKLLSTTTALLTMTLASISAHSADNSIHEIYNLLTQVKIVKSVESNVVDIPEIDMLGKTQSYYRSTFSFLKKNNLTILKEAPKLNLYVMPLNSRNDFAMTASLLEPIVKVWYNTKGSELQLTESPKVALQIKNKKLTIKSQDIFEFSLFHETAHIQHFNAAEFFQVNQLTSEDNYEMGMIYSEHFDLGVDQDIKSQFLENYADFVGSVWYLQKYNFSKDSIQTIKDISIMRDTIDKHSPIDKVHSYKTQQSIEYVLDNIDSLKNMNASELHKAALEYAGHFAFKQLKLIPKNLLSQSSIYKDSSNFQEKIAKHRNYNKALTARACK